MQELYENLITIRKAIVHLHGLQKQSKDFVKRNVKARIVVVHEWTMKYKGAPITLVKKINSQAELENQEFEC